MAGGRERTQLSLKCWLLEVWSCSNEYVGNTNWICVLSGSGGRKGKRLDLGRMGTEYDWGASYEIMNNGIMLREKRETLLMGWHHESECLDYGGCAGRAKGIEVIAKGRGKRDSQKHKEKEVAHGLWKRLDASIRTSLANSWVVQLKNHEKENIQSIAHIKVTLQKWSKIKNLSNEWEWESFLTALKNSEGPYAVIPWSWCVNLSQL